MKEKPDRSRVAGLFRDLAEAYGRMQDRPAKYEHLATTLAEYDDQAGRLVLKAIGAGWFPEAEQARNGGWWGLESGRLPGGPLLTGGLDWHADSGTPLCARHCASSPPPIELWLHTLSSWLVPNFPDHFSGAAAGVDFLHRLPEDDDGNALEYVWTIDGKPVSREVAMEYLRANAPVEAGRVKGELLRPPRVVEARFDEADWLNRGQKQAWVRMAACKLLAELIEANSCRAPAPPKLGPHDAQAWELQQFKGWKQSKIAAELNKEHGLTLKQGQVSRMIARADKHPLIARLAAGRDGQPARTKTRTIDPRKLDRGKRTDGRNPPPRAPDRSQDDDN